MSCLGSRILFVILSLAAIQSSVTLAEESPLEERLDDYASQLLADHSLSAVILIGTPEGVEVLRAYGKASFRDDRPLEPGQLFRIASLTKTFTGAAVQVLADRDALSLDDPLAEHLEPELAAGWEPAHRMTIRHLLRHESGVENPDAREGYESSVDLDGMVERITALPLRFEPGSDGAYSNAGYTLLAHVIERTSGLTYDDFLAREIYGPLGMRSTRVVPNPATDPRHARGHTPAPGPLWAAEPPLIDIGFSIGSGSLSSTAEDLYRWGIALHQNRLFDLGHQVETDWPYGWGKTKVGDLAGVEQTGATDGFMSSLAVFDDGTIVVVLHNLERGDWTRVGRDIAAIALGAPYEPPDRLGSVELPDDLTSFVGTYEQGTQQLEVRQIDGALWLFSDGWRKGRWLAPIGDLRFDIPADWGEIRFERLEQKGYEALVWDFGESESEYVRR